MSRTGANRPWTGDEERNPPDDLGQSAQQDYELPVGVLAPRTQVRVRRFSRFFNLANYQELVELARPSIGYPFPRRASPDSPLAMNEEVRHVRTQEQVVDWHQVRKWVRSGRLQLTDLIDVGRGWETIQACVELGEEVDLSLNRSRWGHRLRVVGLTALFFVLPVALLFTAAWIWDLVFRR